MSVDYDLVIIGGSAAGRYAALTAVQQLARVALVEPEFNEGLYDYAIHPSRPKEWFQEVVANIAEQSKSAVLAAQGVDFIVGSGQFQALPQLAFTVADRPLRAPKYLIASGSLPAIPEIPGLQTAGYWTLANWQQSPSSLPTKWVILGGVPQSVQIAQTLARLGNKVTFIVAQAQILPGFDQEITQLLQAQLEADGVRVFTQTTVTQVQQIQGKKWVQAGMAIEAEEILVATGVQPNLDLNLAAVGVRHSNRLQVNKKLQTTNHRIYACGDVIGGYNFPNLADYEARIALNNALFSQSQVNYQSIPLCVFTEPPLAQVGWTEAQAKRRYPSEDIVVLQQYFKTLAAAQLGNAMTGICKLVVLGNGEIIGGCVLGAAAGELINLIALAIAEKISVKALANLAPIYPSFSEILSQTAQQWEQKLSTNTNFYDSRASYFYRRRRM